MKIIPRLGHAFSLFPFVTLRLNKSAPLPYRRVWGAKGEYALEPLATPYNLYYQRRADAPWVDKLQDEGADTHQS